MADHVGPSTFRIELSPEQKEQIQEAIGQAVAALELTQELKVAAVWPVDPSGRRLQPCRWAMASIAQSHSPQSGDRWHSDERNDG